VRTNSNYEVVRLRAELSQHKKRYEDLVDGLYKVGLVSHCSLCAGCESPGFYTGCLVKDFPDFAHRKLCIEGIVLETLNAEDLASIIRKVDGNHDLGASALAEKIIAEIQGKVVPVILKGIMENANAS
jgi:hypothetical protein